LYEGEGAVFYMGVNFHRGVSGEGTEFFMESEPDLSALFEKRSDLFF
jgi:hypothetical protein